MKGFESQAEVVDHNMLVSIVLTSSSGLFSNFTFSLRPSLKIPGVSKAEKISALMELSVWSQGRNKIKKKNKYI